MNFGVIKKTSVVLLFAIASCLSSDAQWWQPNRVHVGISAGFGGLHEWGKPSFDIYWHRTTLRLAPGLYYASAGITQKIGWFKPRERKDRVIIMSFYYHNDYLLSRLKNSNPKRDLNVFMFMPGIHVNLNYLGTIYFQASAGYTYAREKNFYPDGGDPVIRYHHLPMAEVRIGGVFLSRKEHHQVLKPPKPDVKRIKNTRLKWKK